MIPQRTARCVHAAPDRPVSSTTAAPHSGRQTADLLEPVLHDDDVVAPVVVLDGQAVEARGSRPSRYYSWAELMQRVFAVDVLECPRRRSRPMRILAAIHPPTAQAILKSLGLPTRAPPISPARPPPDDWPLTEPTCSYQAERIDRPAA